MRGLLQYGFDGTKIYSIYLYGPIVMHDHDDPDSHTNTKQESICNPS
jgi:hypothetical protein